MPIVHENLFRSDTEASESEAEKEKQQSHQYVDVMAARQDDVDQRLLQWMLTNCNRAIDANPDPLAVDGLGNSKDGLIDSLRKSGRDGALGKSQGLNKSGRNRGNIEAELKSLKMNVIMPFDTPGIEKGT